MRIINQYIRDIKYSLPVVGKNEKKYLDILKSSLVHYKNNNPLYTYDDLINEFGYPKDIAVSYISEQNDDYLLKHIKAKKTIRYTCIILIVIALFVGLWKGYLIYSDSKESENSRITHIEITAPEEITRYENK